MKIYVAGEVPRENSPAASSKSRFGLSRELPSKELMKIYRQIEDAAAEGTLFTGRRIEFKMPYPDSEVEALDANEFVKYLREEIGHADAVLTVFSSPGIATAFETLLAAELRKPQIILVPRSLAIPRYLRTLPNVLKIDVLGNVKFSDILAQLTTSLHEAEGEYA